MTSINAIKFNDTTGVMIFDEMRSWNPESMLIASAQKMKPIIEDEIIIHTGIVAGYGNTGTSSIGDELRYIIKKKISQKWREEIEKNNKKPKNFMTIEEIANFVYNIICDVKHKHTDELLTGKYGFNTNDIIQGYYIKNGEKIEIKDKEIIKEVEDILTWKNVDGPARPLFLNAGIVAGYDPINGFEIYHISMIEQFCVPVQEIFVSDGSGRDMCGLVLGDYISHKSIIDRRGNIDPTEGIYMGLKAILEASTHNLGVGGYPNIIIFDGKKKGLEKMKFILDDRAKLSSEIVKAENKGFISTSTALMLLNEVCFNDKNIDEIENLFLKNSSSPKDMLFYLRGYGYKE